MKTSCPPICSTSWRHGLMSSGWGRSGISALTRGTSASGWGITGSSTQSGVSYLTNGYPDRKSLNSLAVKLVLANQQSFYAIFTGGSSQVFTAAGSGGIGAIFINELVGLYARGVQ